TRARELARRCAGARTNRRGQRCISAGSGGRMMFMSYETCSHGHALWGMSDGACGGSDRRRHGAVHGGGALDQRDAAAGLGGGQVNLEHHGLADLADVEAAALDLEEGVGDGELEAEAAVAGQAVEALAGEAHLLLGGGLE